MVFSYFVIWKHGRENVCDLELQLPASDALPREGCRNVLVLKSVRLHHLFISTLCSDRWTSQASPFIHPVATMSRGSALFHYLRLDSRHNVYRTSWSRRLNLLLLINCGIYHTNRLDIISKSKKEKKRERDQRELSVNVQKPLIMTSDFRVLSGIAANRFLCKYEMEEIAIAGLTTPVTCAVHLHTVRSHGPKISD